MATNALHDPTDNCISSLDCTGDLHPVLSPIACGVIVSRDYNGYQRVDADLCTGTGKC